MPERQWRKASSLEEAQRLMSEIGERVWVRPFRPDDEWGGTICDRVDELDLAFAHWSAESPTHEVELATPTTEELRIEDEVRDALCKAALDDLAERRGQPPGSFYEDEDDLLPRHHTGSN